MKRYLALILVLLTATINDIGVVNGFSPIDFSSMASAVSAAHIGKPPPSSHSLKSMSSPSSPSFSLHKQSSEETFTSATVSTIFTGFKIDVIGRAPATNLCQSTLSTPNEKVNSSSRSSETLQDSSTDKDPESFQSGACIDDLECILLKQHYELDMYISEVTSTTQSNRYDTHSDYDADDHDDVRDDTDEEIPTIPAIFCGYKATLEEQLRLRSANVLDNFEQSLQ